MCKYAWGAPRIRASGDTSQDQENNFARHDFQWIVGRLVREPEHITAVEGYLTSRADKSKSARGTGATFKDSTSLEKVAADEKYIVAWLAQNSKLRSQDLDRARAYDPDCMTNPFYSGVGATLGLVLPADRASRKLMALALDRRAQEVGERLKNIAVSHGMEENGASSWVKAGPCEVMVAGGKLTKLKFRPDIKETSPPATITITADFALENAHSESKAQFVCGLNQFCVQDLFASGTWPEAAAMKMLSIKSA